MLNGLRLLHILPNFPGATSIPDTRVEKRTEAEREDLFLLVPQIYEPSYDHAARLL